MAQKVDRQPNAWPRAVPAGTPRTLARVSPVNMSAIAWARWWRGTMSAATTEPTPKKAPWQRRGEHARGQQGVVAGGERAQQVAGDEDAHQQQQRQFALQPGSGDGDQRRADG